MSRRRLLAITDRTALALDPAVRAALGGRWRATGEAQLAAACALLDLAARLDRLGAPPTLPARVRRAVARQTDHAERCFDLSARYSSWEVRPGRLRRPVRLPRRRIDELCRVAVDAAREAAWRDAEEFPPAGDARTAAIVELLVAARAEQVAMYRDIVAWCVAEGGAAVGNALAAAQDGTRPQALTVAA